MLTHCGQKFSDQGERMLLAVKERMVQILQS